MEKYKYNTFLTVKHDILKQIKDQKLDELIAVLRKRKFASIYVKSRMLDVVI